MQKGSRRIMLSKFKHNLDMLIKECDTPVDESTVDEQNFYDVISRIIPDSSLEKYIRMLNKEVIAAKKNLVKIKVDVWNNECNEQTIVKLEDELETLKSTEEESKSSLNALSENNSILTEKLADITKQLDNERAARISADKKLVETAKVLIEHREDLLQNKAHIEENDSANVMLKRFAAQELLRVEAALHDVGITILNETGEFDKTRHMIVDMRTTENTDLVGTIAETVSSGYEYNGELLKNQEVVVYKKGL